MEKLERDEKKRDVKEEEKRRRRRREAGKKKNKKRAGKKKRNPWNLLTTIVQIIATFDRYDGISFPECSLFHFFFFFSLLFATSRKLAEEKQGRGSRRERQQVLDSVNNYEARWLVFLRCLTRIDTIILMLNFVFESRQGLIKANHPRVTILIFVGVFAWQHVSHRSNDLSRTAEFWLCHRWKNSSKFPINRGNELSPLNREYTRIWNCSNLFELVGSLGMSNFIVYNSTRFLRDEGKTFYLSVFIVYLVTLNNRNQANGADEKGQIQKSRYLGEEEKYALKNDSGEKYRHDGYGSIRSLEKKFSTTTARNL